MALPFQRAVKYFYIFMECDRCDNKSWNIPFISLKFFRVSTLMSNACFITRWNSGPNKRSLKSLSNPHCRKVHALDDASSKEQANWSKVLKKLKSEQSYKLQHTAKETQTKDLLNISPNHREDGSGCQFVLQCSDHHQA